MSERITVDPLVCHGKPCFRSLRYPVENVLEWLASGMTTEEILADYKDLERKDILAALSYAASLAHVKRLDRLAANNNSGTSLTYFYSSSFVSRTCYRRKKCMR